MYKILGGLLLILAIIFSIEGGAIFLLTQKAEEVIEDAQVYEQEGSGRTILFAGDSTGYGTGASTPEDSVAGRVGVYYPNAHIDNVSKNGYTLAEVVASLPSDKKYDMVVLQAGGNDILKLASRKSIKQDTEVLLARAKEIGDAVYFMTTGDVGAAPAFGPLTSWFLSYRTREVRPIFIEVSERLGITYIDLYEDPKDSVFREDPDRYHSRDGLHPSSEGYSVWFEKLEEKL